jgi:hypothetical protein
VPDQRATQPTQDNYAIAYPILVPNLSINLPAKSIPTA